MAAFRSCKLESFSKINFDKIIGNHNDNLYPKGRYFVFAKHCREKFYSKQKGIYCLCRFAESFWPRKLERSAEYIKDDYKRLQR
jgi:hypothetical protein